MPLLIEYSSYFLFDRPWVRDSAPRWIFLFKDLEVFLSTSEEVLEQYQKLG